MKAIVIAYEDLYHEEFHRLVKALRRDRGLPGIVLEPWPVQGTGNFANEVPRLLHTPLKQTKRPPDRVVCVGDADAPSNLVPGASRPSVEADGPALEKWVLELEASWRAELLKRCAISEEDAARLGVFCLRWSKESLLVSCPDALLDRAGDKRPQVENLLASCVPPPATLAPDEFVVRYRQPSACLDQVFQAVAGRRYK